MLCVFVGRCRAVLVSNVYLAKSLGKWQKNKIRKVFFEMEATLCLNIAEFESRFFSLFEVFCTHPEC